jgi:hypothetical protein
VLRTLGLIPNITKKKKGRKIENQKKCAYIESISQMLGTKDGQK